MHKLCATLLGVRRHELLVNCPGLRHVATRLLTASVVAICLCANGSAQGQTCTRQLSVVLPDLPSLRNDGVDMTVRMLEHSLIMPGAVGIADLTPEAFSARNGKHPVAIRSLTVERGRRRLVFVVENGKQMNAAARKIEAAVISGILSKGRPEDSFALITAGGPRMELHFGSGRDVILTTAEQLASPPQQKEKGQSALDAVEEAASWLDAPQAGDSIFVLALNLEGRHRTSFSKVREALSNGHIRLFGLELGYVTQPDPERLYAGEDITTQLLGMGVGNVDHLLQLSRDSGGAFACENTLQGKKYKLGPAKLERLVAAGGHMYLMAVSYYVLGLDCADGTVVIALLPSVQQKLPQAFVLYPR